MTPRRAPKKEWKDVGTGLALGAEIFRRTAIGWRQQKGKEGKEKGGREEREEREGEVGGGDGAGSPGVQFRL